MVRTLLFSILIIAVAVVLLCVRIVAKRGGAFPSMHIHDSAALRKQGIDCAMEQDKQARAAQQQ